MEQEQNRLTICYKLQTRSPKPTTCDWFKLERRFFWFGEMGDFVDVLKTLNIRKQLVEIHILYYYDPEEPWIHFSVRASTDVGPYHYLQHTLLNDKEVSGVLREITLQALWDLTTFIQQETTVPMLRKEALQALWKVIEFFEHDATPPIDWDALHFPENEG